MVCLTEEQLKAIAEAKAIADKNAEEEAKVQAYIDALGENDTTDIDVVPIIVNDAPYLEIQGMFFNEKEITKDAEPAQELVIEKDVLDRSSGFIIGRFGFAVQNRAKIVFEVSIDGVKIDGYGTNLPYVEKGGVYDTTLFKYPNSAKANKNGKHKIHVKAGVITGGVESALGLVEWGEVKAITEANFVIILKPHKEE